mgnify:CR=1 FL=1
MPPPLARPRFLAIIASHALATMLARKATGKVDGFVVEGPTAGGHNAPPRVTASFGGNLTTPRPAPTMVAAVAASAFAPPVFKRQPEPTRHIERLTLFDGKRRLDFRRTLAAAQGNALARWLTLLPANHLTPAIYLSYVRQLARQNGWRLEFLDRKKLEALGAGAFLAVCQGSAIRLSKRYFTREKIIESIEFLLKDSHARQRAKEIQALSNTWDGTKNTAQFLIQQFG